MIKIRPNLYEGIGIPISGVRRKAFNELNEQVYSGNIKIERVTKCFCESQSFEQLSRFDRYGLPFGTQICVECGLISQSIKFTENSLSIFYEKIYWPLNMNSEDPRTYYTQSASSKSEFIGIINDHLDIDSNDLSVGEVGCSNGIRLEILKNNLNAKKNISLYGCDYSENALIYASNKGVKTFQGGIESLLNVAPLDILIMSHVFEHFTDLKSSLTTIEKLTHDESLIYVEVPGIVDLANKPEYIYNYQYYTNLAHIHNFSLATLSNVFSSRGFILEKGTEYVQAIFRKNVLKPQTVSSSPYSDTMYALEKARKKYLHFMRKNNNPIKKYTKGIAKALLGRV